MFYAIIFVFCTTNSGCDKVLVEDAVVGGLGSCMLRATMILPQWQDQNPTRKFKAARCVEERRVAHELGRDQA